MTPDDLKRLVVLTGDRLELAVDALGEPHLGEHLGARLVLRSAVRTETATGVTVVGTGEGGPFHLLTVTAEFTETGTTIAGTGTDTWSFVDAYPQLDFTVFDSLRFRNPRLRLAPSGMTFTGTLIITTQMAPLDLLMPGADHTVTGEIAMVTALPDSTLPVSPMPSIALLGPEGATLDLGLFQLSGLRYEIFADPEMDYEVGDLTVHGSLVVTGAVPFTTGGVRHEILIATEIFGWDEGLLFVADFSELGQVGFAEVEAFLGRSLAIPFDIDITAPILPTKATMLVTGAKLAAFTLRLETQEEWDIGLFVVQAIDVTFRLEDPGPDARLTVVVNGLFGIGEHGTLEITGGFGDTTALGGALRADDGPLTIREVYTDFTGADASHLPEGLTVTHFDLAVQLPHDGTPLTAQGLIELAGQWAMIEGVVLEDVKFALEIGATTEFVASAQLAISGVGLYLVASYDAEQAWRFSGQTLPGQVIPIGTLINDLAVAFGALPLPAPIAKITLHDLAMSFTTATKQFTYHGSALFPIDTTEVDLTVSIDTYAKQFGGSIAVTVPPDQVLTFTVHFAGAAESTRFAVSYRHDGRNLTVKDLVSALSPTAAAQLPDGLVVAIDDAVLAVDGKTCLFCVDLEATIDLAKLPVVGPRLSGDTMMGFDPLRVIAASGTLPVAAVKEINPLLPSGITELPEQELPPGFTLAGHVRLGPLETPVVLPVTQPPAPVTPRQGQTSDNVLWYKAQTALGPVHVDRIGLAYLHAPGEPARLAVLLDASVSVGGLTLSCDGLAVALNLSDLAALPVFDLKGLGLDYRGGPARISGAFLKDTIVYDGRTYPSYNGKAVIETETFGVGALGSYVELDTGPSLYVYAFLDYPIGGPAFFYVQGLAAGFGYNRRLVAPPVESIADFPLVAEAVGAQQPAGLADELRRLSGALLVSPGDYFLAVGVHFTTFKMIDSFLLLTVGFGHRFELNVLGLSTLILPAPDAEQGPVTPVAEIQLALKATFAPDDGYFSLLAQLTPNSYLLSKSCRLTGGFAYVTWFGEEHNGDFVLTVGGYHPHFTVPAHYPSVPRLGFNWQVSNELSLKGSAYYALTPSALMAGGSLTANYLDGSLHAWFDTSLDFLISWQPYHYEAAFHLAIGASYTFWLFGTHTITVQVGTDVRFWGPEFGGTATIDLDIISITVDFGSRSGASAEPVPWSRFRDAQLPEPGKITTIAVRRGALHPGSGSDLGVLNPLELELVTDSVIPSTRGLAGTAELGTGVAFGVAPVGKKDGFSSTHQITITRNGTAAEQHFRYEPVGKNLPAAQWGFELTPTLTKPALMEGLLCGYVIRPAPPEEPAPVIVEVPRSTPLFTEDDAFDWHPVAGFTPSGRPLDLTAGAAARTAIGGKLLSDVVIDLGGLTADDFLQTPRVG